MNNLFLSGAYSQFASLQGVLEEELQSSDGCQWPVNLQDSGDFNHAGNGRYNVKAMLLTVTLVFLLLAQKVSEGLIVPALVLLRAFLMLLTSPGACIALRSLLAWFACFSGSASSSTPSCCRAAALDIARPSSKAVCNGALPCCIPSLNLYGPTDLKKVHSALQRTTEPLGALTMERLHCSARSKQRGHRSELLMIVSYLLCITTEDDSQGTALSVPAVVQPVFTALPCTCA